MKTRLDVALVERGLVDTRTRAQALIMAGDVLVNGQRAEKPGHSVAPDARIELKAAMPYVGRGGLKLAHAVSAFGLASRISGKVALDIGSSTGGFTEVLLQNGAVRVYAVDVGTNQLAWKLRQDHRVVPMEQTNVRYLESLPEPAGVVTADVSYIGLDLVSPTAMRLAREDAFFVFLIKPQFEAGREHVSRGGVVRNPAVHSDVIIRLAGFWKTLGLTPAGLVRSPVTGPAGNVEYLVLLERQARETQFDLDEALGREVLVT